MNVEHSKQEMFRLAECLLGRAESAFYTEMKEILDEALYDLAFAIADGKLQEFLDQNPDVVKLAKLLTSVSQTHREADILADGLKGPRLAVKVEVAS